VKRGMRKLIQPVPKTGHLQTKNVLKLTVFEIVTVRIEQCYFEYKTIFCHEFPNCIFPNCTKNKEKV